MSRYALVDLNSNLVVNVIELDEQSNWPVPDGFIVIQSDSASIGWNYINGELSAPPVPPIPDEQLAVNARNERDQLLRSVYDQGINMALRAVRTASTPEQVTYAEGKVVELDAYAELLLGIPEQAGFPRTIIWPVAPTK